MNQGHYATSICEQVGLHVYLSKVNTIAVHSNNTAVNSIAQQLVCSDRLVVQGNGHSLGIDCHELNQF